MALQHVFCPKCDDIRAVEVKIREETYPVRGVDIAVDANVAVCTQCNDDVWTAELDDENLERAYTIYRQKYRIPSPDEIRALRGKYGLSQRAFARLLGWGGATISRYESGALPDLGQSLVLRLVADPLVLARYVQFNGSVLTPAEKAKLERAMPLATLRMLSDLLTRSFISVRDEKDALKQRGYSARLIASAHSVHHASKSEWVHFVDALHGEESDRLDQRGTSWEALVGRTTGRVM